jgi:outer membrane protein assembly factor BamE (lipoprotein component of BamABCDE complex)
MRKLSAVWRRGAGMSKGASGRAGSAARGPWWAAGLAALILGLATVGCDQQRIKELEEGVSTEADVRARFGEPAAIYAETDGGRTFEYPRQPEGQTNYMITIGGDGKMSALRQVVRPDLFAKVTPGLDKAQVRRLIGRPATTQVYDLKQEEVWDWRYHANGENRLFAVTFDMAGKVTGTQTLLDPKGVEAGGGK